MTSSSKLGQEALPRVVKKPPGQQNRLVVYIPVGKSPNSPVVGKGQLFVEVIDGKKLKIDIQIGHKAGQVQKR